MTERDYPIALLVALDGTERVVPVTEPPPPVYEVPIPQKWVLDPPIAPPKYVPMPRRLFRLSRMSAPDRRWYRIYNEGRTCTPEHAYVYFEARA